MNFERHLPSYPEKLTVALLGKRVQLKNSIGRMILSSNSVFEAMLSNIVVEANKTFKIINTPDFFEEECLDPEQLIIDLMAHTHPGPNLFILAIDPEDIQEEKVVAQILKLQETFGEKITAHLVVILPDIENVNSLSHLTHKFNTRLSIANENLASECKKWCSANQPFLYDFKNYSQDDVIRRKAALEKRSHYDVHQPHQHRRDSYRSQCTSQHAFAAPDRAAAPEHHIGNSTSDTPDDIFNIVLLGLTGTGKSASANTILAAGHSKLASKDLFKSESSSLPVTTQCQTEIVDKPFGMKVRLVDTPDFLHSQFENSQREVEECRKYCQPGRCMVLLVLQLGRFTDAERGILQELENTIGWNFRESTIVLLTHGEDLDGSLEQFINANYHLKSIIEQCGQRCHLFSNRSKNSMQVIQLIKKMQDFNTTFPKVNENKTTCCLL